MPLSKKEQDKLRELIPAHPDQFMENISQHPDRFTSAFAATLDACDPLAGLRKHFDLRALTLFAGHSLGPVFKPAIKKQHEVTELRAEKAHDGHFLQTQDQGGNWFDIDIERKAIAAMQQALGFAEPHEFLYTQLGLSDNLARLMRTFYRPAREEWVSGKTKICHLDSEFFSDQAIVHSIIKGELADLKRLGIAVPQDTLHPDKHILKIKPNEMGLYSEQVIIDFVKSHAHEIQILHLSDNIFSTGQRLKLDYIFNELQETIKAHGIIVGLDLAHTVGNRTTKLKDWPVTYAVGCNYKHCCGSAGSGFGIYVNANADLERYPPIQGWKAADSFRVFGKINTYDPSIMTHAKGAWAFRCSNPSPIAIIEAQEYMKTMSAVGWDKLTAKSECLTRYMHALLVARLGDQIQFVTPLDPSKRGATLVFRIPGLNEEKTLEHMLKDAGGDGLFELDTRPPNNFRVTAHYAYTRFADIVKLVSRLEQALQQLQALTSDAAAGKTALMWEKIHHQSLGFVQHKYDHATTKLNQLQGRRYHFFNINLDGYNETGDALKTKLLFKYTQTLLVAKENNNLDEVFAKIKQEQAYKEGLAKGQGFMTRLFKLRTSSEVALDTIKQEIETQDRPIRR